jgi:PAS domain S-box-containing protein
MSVATGEALADLANTLASASTGTGMVLETATRSATTLIGDAAGIRLARTDGGYEPVRMYHPDAGQADTLGKILSRTGDRVDEGFSTTMRATGQPMVLPALTRDQFHQLAPPRYWPDLDRVGLHAAMLCPLMSRNVFLGYLVLVRTTAGATYDPADVALARDVTSLVAGAVATARSVDQLRASEDRYRRIVETTHEGVWQLDLAGVTTFVNEPMAAMLGMTTERLIGLSMRGFLNDQGQAEFTRRLEQWRQGGAELYETRLVRADGSIRWVQVSSAPLPGDFEHAPGALCLVTDITEQVYARGQRRQLDHLRRLDSLGQLMGGITHDFKNLFTVIAGSAEILAAESEVGGRDHELATQIISAAAGGRSLTNQLLAFGRGGGGRTEILSVPDLLEDVHHLIARTVGERTRLEINAAPECWLVRADRGQLEQVLVNLAANARDAMPRGGVLGVEATNVVIDPGDLDDPDMVGRFVRLSISDTGAGMDDRTLAHALEPFFTTKPTAAGLGLATADSIIRAGGGHLRITSQPRHGTTVTLHLPAADTVDPVRTVAGDRPARPAHGHILAVEDQPELAHLLRKLLEPAGYTVTVATQPEQAMRHAAAGEPIDLLLTDVIMPEMNGPELARALRTTRPNLPVVYLSGYSAAILGAQGQLEPDSVLVQKPFNRGVLLAAVERSLPPAPPDPDDQTSNPAGV